MPIKESSLSLLIVLGGLCGCGTSEGELSAVNASADAPRVEFASPAALELTGSAYEAAADLVLPEREAAQLDGLHNVLQLSDSIISGAEPDGEAAFQELARLGVRTILSVDGKLPDVEAAARMGMRYVHVPIQYSGITPDEQGRILKTFRELEGPFYVHCFHGVHRGPAAAALGRVALDGAPREQALAEMRQWCGTSKKYEGLYQTVATAQLPDAEQTAALDYDFAAATPITGTAAFMVEIARPFDRIKGFAKNDWQVQADHPDLDPVNEAAILAQLLERTGELEGAVSWAQDFAEGMAEAGPQARALHEALRAARSAGGDWDEARIALDALAATCNACHVAHRN